MYICMYIDIYISISFSLLKLNILIVKFSNILTSALSTHPL